MKYFQWSDTAVRAVAVAQFVVLDILFFTLFISALRRAVVAKLEKH